MTVYIDGLIYKCSQIGITGNPLCWLLRFLLGRNIKVYWRKVTSAPRSIGRGFPQGVVLNPVLFTIFMTDFIEILEGLGVKCLIYADDIFLYCENRSLEICRDKLQELLRLIIRWCSHWKLSLRSDKCHAINLSRCCTDCDFNFSSQ